MSYKKVPTRGWRKFSIALWPDVSDAVRFCQFELDVTKLKLKKRDTWTLEFIQLISKVFQKNPHWNRQVFRSSLYQKKDIDVYLRIGPVENELKVCYLRDTASRDSKDISDQISKIKHKQSNNLISSFPFIVLKIAMMIQKFILKYIILNLPRKIDFFRPTVSLSNVGNFGAPVITPCVSDLLFAPYWICLGSVIKKEDGTTILPISVGIDHRVLDGDDFAKFLAELQNMANEL